MTTMEIYYAALFNRAPTIGEINPKGEIFYKGYTRVPLIAGGGTNLTNIVFPPSEQDDPVFVSCVVVLDASEKVIGVAHNVEARSGPATEGETK